MYFFNYSESVNLRTLFKQSYINASTRLNLFVGNTAKAKMTACFINNTKHVASLLKNNFAKVLAIVVFGAVVNVGWGQTSLTNASPSNTQNFDAMGSSATASLPANWKMSGAGLGSSSGWLDVGNFTAVTIAANSGSPATGGRYNWGTSATERSLGVMTSAGYASTSGVMSFYTNGGTTNITALTISYDLERYRINSKAASVSFYYSLNGTSWTSLADGDIAAAALPTGTSAYNYTTTGAPSLTNCGVINKSNITISSLNIAPSSSFYLKWVLNTGGGNSQGIGIDNVICTATFSSPTYSLTYNGNGNTSGTAPVDATSPYAAAASVTTLTDNGLLKTGSTFAGWNTLATGLGTDIAVNSSYTMPAANTILYAKWTTNNYTVTFDANTGSGSMSNQTITYGASSNLTSNAFTKPGYTFAGWNTLANGTGTSYTNSQSYTMGAANTTLYAQWTANNNTLTFDGNGATSGSMAAQTIATNASANLTSNGFIKSGNNFSGWSTTAGGSVTYSDGASYTIGTSNATLYAVWTIATFPTISYSGSLIAVNTTYGTASATPATFSVSGSALTNNITLTAPAGYELSSGSSYSTSLILTQSGGVVSSTPIYIRLAATTAAGTYSGNVVLTSSGATTVNVATISSTVSPAVLTISGLTGANKEYDATAAATYTGTASYVGLVNGETFSVSGTPSATFNTSGVGSNKPITIAGFTTPSANYTLTEPSLTADITAKALTISGASAVNKPYDGTTVATISGGTLSGVESGDVVTLSQTGTFSTSSVGNSITVNSMSTIGGASSANYSLTQPSGLSADISIVNLTITANDVSKNTGVALTDGPGSAAFTPSGLVNSETIGSVTLTYGSAGATTGDGNTAGVYASQVTPSAAIGGTFNASNYTITYVAGSITVTETPVTIAAWDFFGESNQVNSNADVSNVNLISAPSLSRGSSAAFSAGANSFRTVGFQNNGISTANTDYFQTSIQSSSSNVSLSSIDAFFAGTAGFFATPGVTSQFAYSLNGTSYTLIGSPQISSSTTLNQINLSGISALQNVAAGTTIYLRYYASGQTTTGGWGFASSAAGVYGLKIQGTVKSVPTLSLPTSATITETSATLGATVTNNGGSTISSRGTVYGTSASPTLNAVAEGGTTVSLYTQSRTGFAANTLYYYRGYAINAIGTGYSADGIFTTLHNAPTIGSGSNATSSTTDANWTAPSGGSAAFTYEIQVDDNNDFSSPEFTQSSIASASTSVTATGLVSNTTYYYRVRANNDGGSSAWSATSAGYSTLVVVNPTLSATGLTAFGNVCLNTVSAANSFTINGSALTTADITVSALSGYTFSTSIGGTYTNSLTLTQTGGSYSQLIYVKLTSTAATSYDGNIVVGGGGAASSVNVAASGSGISGTVAVTTTIASSITTSSSSTGGSSISTTCGTITAKGVAYGTSSNPSSPVTSDGSGTANYTSSLIGLIPNTDYFYRAYATNDNGVTNYGSNLSFTTLHNAPTIGTGSAILTAGFTANWSAPVSGGSATFTYEVAVSTSPTFTTTLSSQTGITSATTNYQLTGLSSGTTYYYRVRANNTGGSSDWSTISVGITTQTVFENFETGTKGSYTAANVTCSAGSWNLNDAVIATSTSDKKNGLQSVRIRNTGIVSMNFDRVNGIASLTIYHALYGTDASSTWRLEVSNNGGSSWDAYTSSAVTTSSATLTAQTFNVDLCGTLRFRIVKLSGGTARINIDDIVLVDKAATPAAPTASPQSFCNALSTALVSDLAATGTATQWYTASSGGTALTTSTALASGTYYATQTISSCESQTRAAVVVSLSNIIPSTTPAIGDLVWNGRTDSNFGASSNWYEYNGATFTNTSALPSGSTNIIIPANESICVLQQPSTLTNGGSARNITIETGASLTMVSGTMTIGGNWKNKGTFNPGTGTVEFNGASDQTISNTAGETFNELTINKGSGVVLLSNDLTISNQLNLTNGIIDIQASNLNMASNTLINGGTATSYVRTSGAGALKRTVSNSAMAFPVGKSAYNPATLTNNGDSDIFSVSVYDHVSTTGVEGGTPTTGQAVKRTWMVSEALTGGSNVTLNLQWNAGEEVNGFVYEPGLMNVNHHNGSIWEELGATAQGDAPYFVETSGISSFSPFTIGKTGSPLPIELISFQANCLDDKTITISWSTASEHNTSHFIVEKSRDGKNWTDLSVVAAAGNSTSILDYEIMNLSSVEEVNYYRLTQYDTDGAKETFFITTANCTEEKTNRLITYPNPSDNDFSVDFYSEEMIGAGILKITDTRGMVIHSQEVSIIKGSNVFTISDLIAAPGVYYIQVSSRTTQSYIIKHSLR
jgi:uncharacterized repeat protein (TIGR02543 family)